MLPPVNWLAAAPVLVLIVYGQTGRACQPPFASVSGGPCLYLNTVATVSWCEAASLCQDIGGELPMDPVAIRAVRSRASSGVFLWIGVNDLLVECGTSKSGWQMNNGSQFPALGSSDWSAGMPNNMDASDDLLAVDATGLGDFRSLNRLGFACQPTATRYSGVFKRASFLQLGNITPYYCYTEIGSVERRMLCVQRCASRWQCRAALYNQAEARCRMLDYADASVGDGIEKSGGWVKFVKVLAE